MPLYALRAQQELELTDEGRAACEELRDYKREEKEACFRAWDAVKQFPKTEINLTLEKWTERRAQTRKEQIELIRNHIKPELRARYNEVLFQCCIYLGDFFLAAEIGGMELDDEVAKQLRDKFNSAEFRKGYEPELESYRQMVETELLKKKFGMDINLGAPSQAALEIRDGVGSIFARVMYPYHFTYGQLLHATVVRELGLNQEQVGRLNAIGRKHGMKETTPEFGEDFLFDGNPNVDPQVEMAKSKEIVKELNSVLTKGQQERFRQIQAQALIARGVRDEALSLLGINAKRDHHRDRNIDRVKNAISADYQLMKAREILGTVISTAEIDRAMGPPSFEFLDSQSPGFGGAIGGERDKRIVPRQGPAFDKLARQVGPWYAGAIQDHVKAHQQYHQKTQQQSPRNQN